MSTIDKPVNAIVHTGEKRATLPTTELAGEETEVVSHAPKEAAYRTFKNEFVRGRDPELYWLRKYDNDDEETQAPDLKVDIRSLYVHEDIRPEMLIKGLYRIKEDNNTGMMSLFGSDIPNTIIEDELERVTEYYQHNADWKNRLIQGDSLLVMNSLLKREGMAGKVQCVYIDPPYGIKYGSNWQMKLNNREVKDNDQSVSGEPEMIKAFRDTWELGIHSYLTYLRDRLVLSRDLLSPSGSCFVQISDENVHLVRNIMDEVFGSENFVSQIIYTKTTGFTTNTLGGVVDYIIWYAKDIENIKVRKLFVEKDYAADGKLYSRLEMKDGTIISVSEYEKNTGIPFNYTNRPKGSRAYRIDNLTSQGNASTEQPFEFNGKIYYPTRGNHWKAQYPEGMERLKELKRLQATDKGLYYVRYFDDFPCTEVNNLWQDTVIGGFNEEKLYVVQSSIKPIQRCLLMTTDPGDLVLDPTCGSGTTAFVAEQWGRRWITIDTSRIALNIAKKRLTTAVFPYYELFGENIRHGFKYKKVPHITLKSLANNEQADEEVLYDQPEENKRKIRVSGPFTVETLQSFNVTSPEAIYHSSDEAEENRLFQERIFSHLQTSGIRNGDKTQQAIFHGVEAVSDPFLNAKGYYNDADGRERLVFFHIGPKFGSVSKRAVNEAVRTFRDTRLQEGASWLVLLGFSFQDSIEDKDYNLGQFTVSKVRMHDDLMQDGLLKKDKGAGSFITIGEPDIALVVDSPATCHIEIRGLDIYDPIKDDVKARSIEDIAYWEIDDNYDGRQFIVKSMHFCGGDKKEFDAWKKGLNSVASLSTKKKAEHTLRIELDDEMWDTLYGFESETLQYVPGRKIAVRVISQFGEESSKVITMK
jgi:adenine-specific DNA-methyltransferase